VTIKRLSTTLTSLCWLLLLYALPARSVLFYSTGDPSFNTNAPGTRALTNSGWQFVGAWAGFSGTVISSNCFLTAKHVGGAIGAPFEFQGSNYLTTASYDDPTGDLRIWRVSGQFPIYAPLYTKRNERSKNLVVIGRGTQRGAEFRLNGKLKGWLWGPGDDVQRWGVNRVQSVVDGGAGLGELLRATFVAAGGRNEAALSAGDSGGPVFIKDGKFYKLAGINYAVDGPYSTTNSGPGFDASLFDRRGLYQETSADTWTLIPGRGGKLPGGFYATRVSSRVEWINGTLSQQTP
jgi:hypothetical protein